MDVALGGDVGAAPRTVNADLEQGLVVELPRVQIQIPGERGPVYNYRTT